MGCWEIRPALKSSAQDAYWCLARADWSGVVANYAKGADWVMKQGECRILVGCGNRWGVVANYAQADFYFVRTRS